MTSKIKPMTALIGALALAPLAMLSTETAWSEVPGKGDARKPVVKKKAKKPQTRKPAPKPVVQNKAKPDTANAQPVLALKPAEQLPVLPAPAPVAVNPYLPGAPVAAVATPQVVTPSAVPQAAGPASAAAPAYRNPYLAYLYTGPVKAPVAAPTPWSLPNPWGQAAQAAPTPWSNPFLAIRPPVFPGQPWTPPQAPLSAPAPVAPPSSNPYLNPYLPQAAAPAPQAQPAPAPTPLPFPALVAPNWVAPFPALPSPAPAGGPANRPWIPPVQAAVQPTPAAHLAASSNPYLAYLRAPAPAASAPLPAAAPVPATAPEIVVNAPAPRMSEPVYQPAQSAEVETSRPARNDPSPWEKLKYSVMGGIPPITDQAILPKITTVYPTGEKPLKVLTFKCPTELVGITPPTTALLHDAVTFAFDGVNKTNLLPFNLQQVCQ